MTDLNDFFKTDLQDDHVAADVNNLIAATLRSEYKNAETLSGTRTLTDADTPIQRLDCNGANRIVKLPTADSVDNHPFMIVNATSGTAYTLTIKNNAGTVTYAVLLKGGAVIAYPDGNGGYFPINFDPNGQLWTELASDPSTPATGQWNLFFKSGGLYHIDDAGNVTGPLVPGASADMYSPLTAAEISITGATTATISRQHVCSGSTNYTVTLPAASGNTGKYIGLRFTNTGITTLDGNSSETIDGATTRAYYQGQSAILYCDGSNWHSLTYLGAIRTQFVLITQCTFSGTMTEAFNSAQKLGFIVYQSSPANGDYFEFAVWLNKGTYTCKVHGSSGSNFGKMDWTLDGTSQTTGQDWYSASGTNVWNVDKTFSVTVPFTGYHVMRGTVNGKNASSGNYYYGLTAFVFYPSAY